MAQLVIEYGSAFDMLMGDAVLVFRDDPKSDGLKEDAVDGNQLNLASRLQSAASPGEVLLSHATGFLVRDEFECALQSPFTSRGSSMRASSTR